MEKEYRQKDMYALVHDYLNLTEKI